MILLLSSPAILDVFSSYIFCVQMLIAIQQEQECIVLVLRYHICIFSFQLLFVLTVLQVVIHQTRTISWRIIRNRYTRTRGHMKPGTIEANPPLSGHHCSIPTSNATICSLENKAEPNFAAVQRSFMLFPGMVDNFAYKWWRGNLHFLCKNY